EARGRLRRGTGRGVRRPRRPRRRSGRLPNPRLQVSLRLDEDVDDRAVVDVLTVDLGRDAALEQRAPLLDLLAHDVEEGVVRDAVEDLLLVVQGQIRRDRTGELPRPLRVVDQRGHRGPCYSSVASEARMLPARSVVAARS